MKPQDKPGIKSRLNALIDQYWDLAYAEGAEKRDHDTASGDAQKTRQEITELIDQLVAITDQ